MQWPRWEKHEHTNRYTEIDWNQYSGDKLHLVSSCNLFLWSASSSEHSVQWKRREDTAWLVFLSIFNT